MAIPQLGEIPPAPPPPPNRAVPKQRKLQRIKSQMQKFAAKMKLILAKLQLLFLSVVVFFTNIFKHFYDIYKRKMSCYFGSIFQLGPSTLILILIVWSYSTGGKGIFNMLEGNSTDSSSSMLGPPGLVIGVLSSRDNFMQRQAVRHTWAAKLHTSQHQDLLPSQLLFVLGDQDCLIHPRLCASNPNHCPHLPDDSTALVSERDVQDDAGGQYDQNWLNIVITNNISDGNDRSRLQQERCMLGLGVMPLTNVMWSSIRVPFTKETSQPRVWIKYNNESVEQKLELETGPEGPVWVGDNFMYLLPEGAEVEIIVVMENDECMEIIRNKQCEWRDGNGSVQYTFVRHSDGSVRQWLSHHCLPFTLHFENGAEQCPSGWSLYHGHCYFFSKDRKNWQDAQADCEARHSSSLATVHDDKVNEYLLRGGKVDQGRQQWVGLRFLAQQSYFQWVDGSDINYTNWDSYEPNNNRNREQCVEMLPYSGKWNDDSCDNVHHYVCQKKRMSDDGLLRRTLTTSERQSLQHSWRDTRATVGENVIREQKLFGDLLLVPGLVDTYGSLPDKLKALIQWSNAAFPGYWLMKTDDDTYISVSRVLDVLAQAAAAANTSSSAPSTPNGASSPYGESRCPGGSVPPAVFSQFQGLRSVPRQGKWRELDYTGLTFPEFPAGGGYILTDSVVAGLAAAAPTLRSYQGEDVSLGVWLSSLTFRCPRSPSLGAKDWLGTVVEGGSQLMSATAPVLHTLKQELLWVLETLFLARVSTTASSTSSQQPHPPVLPPSSSATAPHSPALLISVSCWLRSDSCNDSYVVAPDLSIDRLDALHKASISR